MRYYLTFVSMAMQRIKGELCLKVISVDALGCGVKAMASHGSHLNLAK